MGPIGSCYDCDVLRKETRNYTTEEIRGLFQKWFYINPIAYNIIKNQNSALLSQD